MISKMCRLFFFLCGLLVASLPAQAEEQALVTQPAFNGKIAPTLNASVPDWPKQLKAKPGAPNVVLILLDDVGFGAASTFGGAAATPELDHLASQGLRYNRFHTAGLCSPTRAALLSGRNHHQVGFGNLSEAA